MSQKGEDANKSGAPGQTPAVPICRFFLQGGCMHGSNCRFSHVKAAGADMGPPKQPHLMPNPYIVSFPQGTPIFSVDVECVATSKLHNARSVAHLALVDEWCQPVCSIYVKQELPVVSYLTPLTGLTKALIDDHGVPLADALIRLRSQIPASAVLVGQNVKKDVEWLNLAEGLDFSSMVDLAALFKVWDTVHNRWTVFSQDHVAKCWLGMGERPAHDALTDATISMSLFNAYRHCQWDNDRLHQMKMYTLSTPRSPSYSAMNGSVDGCCLGHRKTCTCGAPFFITS